jgi:hypothetical protein
MAVRAMPARPAMEVTELRLDDLPFARDRGVLRTLSVRRDQFVRQHGGEEGS